MSEQFKDTAKYKPVTCYQCGEPMIAARFKDVYTMRIDGEPHQVPVYSVPCMQCVPCDIALVDGSSDEVIHHWYVDYCKKNGLWTPWHRLRRWVRRQRERLYYRLERWRGR